MRHRLTTLLAAAVLMAGAIACSGAGAPAAAGGEAGAAALREAALAAARVWRPPSVPIAAADLGSNPRVEGSFPAHDALT